MTLCPQPPISLPRLFFGSFRYDQLSSMNSWPREGTAATGTPYSAEPLHFFSLATSAFMTRTSLVSSYAAAAPLRSPPVSPRSSQTTTGHFLHATPHNPPHKGEDRLASLPPTPPSTPQRSSLMTPWIRPPSLPLFSPSSHGFHHRSPRRRLSPRCWPATNLQTPTVPPQTSATLMAPVGVVPVPSSAPYLVSDLFTCTWRTSLAILHSTSPPCFYGESCLRGSSPTQCPVIPSPDPT